MQNLYLFSGENQYELRTEIKKRKDSFAEKFGAECVFSYTSENRDTGIIKQNLYGGGFFSSKKLIFLFGLPIDTETTNKLKADQREKLSEELISANHILEDTIVICISYKPDKRGKFYKRISKEGQVKEF
jgi:DNA polymerase III delta subunit